VIDEAFEITQKEFFSTITGEPIDLKILKKLQKEFEELGGALLHNDESLA